MSYGIMTYHFSTASIEHTFLHKVYLNEASITGRLMVKSKVLFATILTVKVSTNAKTERIYPR